MFAAPIRRKQARCRRARRPRLESLEDRSLLTAYVVDTIADDPLATAADTDGFVSLREAIQAANTNGTFGDAAAGDGGTADEITFAAALTGQTIVLGGAELAISDDLKITGLGASNLTISGNIASRVLSVQANATLEISEMTIADGRMLLGGGGIYNEGAVTVENSVFADNLGPLGGAIHNKGTMSIAGSEFSANRASDGAAIWTSGTLQITSSSFFNNIAFSSGGGIWNEGVLEVSGGMFSGNRANSDGGGIWNTGVVHVGNVAFSQNLSGAHGGAIGNSHLGTATLDGGTFTNNSAWKGGGVANSGAMDVAHAAVSQNSADSVGGGIWNRGALEIMDVEFFNNSTVVRTTNGNGGAIGNTNGGTIRVTGSEFVGNQAGTGGAIDNFGQGFGAFGSIEVINSNFSGNSSAFSGGAIWSDDPATISGSTFTENVAGSFGGAIHIRFDALTITESTIANNSAEFGGGVDIWGAEVEISGSTISGNTSVVEGGGIENFGGTLSLRNTTVSGNSTEGQGGGIWSLGTLEMTNTTIAFNRADAEGNGDGSGGGLHHVASTSYPDPLLNNTLVAGNLLGAAGSDAPEDIYGSVDPTSSHNLIGDAATAGGLTDGVNGNIVGNSGAGTIDITTLLDPNLSDNGGSTLTHALQPAVPRSMAAITRWRWMETEFRWCLTSAASDFLASSAPRSISAPLRFSRDRCRSM
jgi:predicted outer membrane repeat protein